MSDLLTQNTKLASKINDLTGMDAQTACAGFKNLGQCVAAAHVSKNLGIGFDTLKGKVTGPDAENLGKAIHGLNPKVNAKSEAKKAQKQAHADLKHSNS
jgi:erythromycin esterase-like protein